MQIVEVEDCSIITMQSSSLFTSNTALSSLPMMSDCNLNLLRDFEEEEGEEENCKSTPSSSTDRDGSVRVHSGSGFRFVVPFPWRLHQILEENVDESVISWMPDGRHFHVHNPTLFVQEIIPKFFKQKSFKSFQRQLHIYGFQRVADFPNQGAYYHDKFIRGNRKLALEITRIKAPPRRRINAKAAKEEKMQQMQQHALALEPLRREITIPAPRPLSSDTTEWLINAGVPFAALDPYPVNWGRSNNKNKEPSIFDCASEITSIFNF